MNNAVQIFMQVTYSCLSSHLFQFCSVSVILYSEIEFIEPPALPEGPINSALFVHPSVRQSVFNTLFVGLAHFSDFWHEIRVKRL